MTVPVQRPHEFCQYPLCSEAPDIDLCKKHSQRWGRVRSRHRDRGLLPNDGIFDWTAVDAAVRGLRVVRMTWVEREVAAITLYARGYEPHEVEERLGAPFAQSRWQKIRDFVGGDRQERKKDIVSPEEVYRIGRNS